MAAVRPGRACAALIAAWTSWACVGSARRLRKDDATPDSRPFARAQSPNSALLEYQQTGGKEIAQVWLVARAPTKSSWKMLKIQAVPTSFTMTESTTIKEVKEYVIGTDAFQHFLIHYPKSLFFRTNLEYWALKVSGAEDVQDTDTLATLRDTSVAPDKMLTVQFSLDFITLYIDCPACTKNIELTPVQIPKQVLVKWTVAHLKAHLEKEWDTPEIVENPAFQLMAKSGSSGASSEVMMDHKTLKDYHQVVHGAKLSVDMLCTVHVVAPGEAFNEADDQIAVVSLYQSDMQHLTVASGIRAVVAQEWDIKDTFPLVRNGEIMDGAQMLSELGLKPGEKLQIPAEYFTDDEIPFHQYSVKHFRLAQLAQEADPEYSDDDFLSGWSPTGAPDMTSDIGVEDRDNSGSMLKRFSTFVSNSLRNIMGGQNEQQQPQSDRMVKMKDVGSKAPAPKSWFRTSTVGQVLGKTSSNTISTRAGTGNGNRGDHGDHGDRGDLSRIFKG